MYVLKMKTYARNEKKPPAAGDGVTDLGIRIGIEALASVLVARSGRVSRRRATITVSVVRFRGCCSQRNCARRARRGVLGAGGRPSWIAPGWIEVNGSAEM